MKDRMDNKVDGMLEYSADLRETRQVLGVETAAPWQRVIEEMRQEYYPKKSSKFTKYMFAGAIQSVVRELGEGNAAQIGRDIELFWERRKEFLTEEPNITLKAEDGKEELISKRELFERMSLKDKLYWAAMTGRECRENELNAAKEAVKEAAEQPGPDAPVSGLGDMVRAISSLRIDKGFMGWLKSLGDKIGEKWEEVSRMVRGGREGWKMPDLKVALGVLSIAYLVACVHYYYISNWGYLAAAESKPRSAAVAPVFEQERSAFASPTPFVPEEETKILDGHQSAEPEPLPVTEELGNASGEAEWNLGGIDLRQRFFVVVPAEVATDMGMPTESDLQWTIDPRPEEGKGWSDEIFKDLPNYRKYPSYGVVMRTHVPGVVAIGAHSGVVGGGWLPFEWLARGDAHMWNGKEIVIRDERGKEVRVRLKLVMDVDKQILSDSDVVGMGVDGGVPSIHLRLTGLGVKKEDYDGIIGVFFTCSKGGGLTFEERRFALFELVKPEANENGEGEDILPDEVKYEKSEYLPRLKPNIDVAVKYVNEHFSKNKLGPGNRFSMLEVLNHFRDKKDWIQDNSKLGDGACDVATMIWRAFRRYAQINGITIERLMNEGGYEVYRIKDLTVKLRPHSPYKRMPKDMVSLFTWGKDHADNTDFIIENMGDSRFEVKIRFDEESGNYLAVVTDLSGMQDGAR